jgi:tetratricopeptide (TPR) repeat protein
MALAVPLWAAPNQGQGLQTEQADRDQGRILVARGRHLLAQGDYGAALDTFRKAAKLDPDNRTIARLMSSTETAIRLGRGGDLNRSIQEQRASRTRSIIRQAEHSLFDAQKALDAKDYRRARQHAERAKTAIRYVDSAERAATLKERAEGIVASASKALDAELQEQRQRDLARARADAQAARSQPVRRDAPGLQVLRRKARRLQVVGDHDQALAVARDLLRINPDDEEAKAIESRALEAAKGPDDVAGRSASRARREDLLMDQLEKEATPPPSGKVVLPGKDARRAPAAPREEPMEPWEQELRRKLAEEVTIEFKATPLEDCVEQLAAIGQVNVVLDPDAARQTPITIDQTRMPLESLLRWVARFGELQYCLRDGAVLLTTGRGVLDEPERRVYDISPLVVPEDDAVPTSVIDASEGMAGPLEPQSPRRAEPKPKKVDVEAIGQGWVAFMRDTVAPGTWDLGRTAQQAGPQYSIQYRNGRIVVVHTPEVHRQIEDLLNSFRRARNLQVHILGRFLRVEKTFIERLTLAEFNWSGPDANGPGEDPTGGKRYAFTPINLSNNTDVVRTVSDPLSPGAAPIERPLARFSGASASGGLELAWDYIGVNGHTADALINAVLKNRKSTLLQAPRLTCFNTQRANMQVLVNHNYVRTISADEEPEIGNVPEGIIFDVQPFVSADRRYITLVLQPQQRELLDLIAFSYSTGATEVAEGLAALTERVIQIPTSRLRSLGTTVTIPNGGTLIAGGFTEVEERTGQAGVPILEAVPLLRQVMRGFDDADGRRSLIMLITAETVEDIFEEGQ